ncbi:MAG: bifunctional phosphopantothenoylcysteine decarboxylase/phosphopantothenate--cysteine ligase CoaBC [Thermoprotei archaeon]
MSLREIVKKSLYAPLTGKNIVLGLTASSAVYRSIDLARNLLRLGANIRVVMSKESLKLIGETLVEWATGSKPYTELTGSVEHLELSDWADLMVIVPATLKTMAKISSGIGDELLPLLAISMIGVGKPVMVVPTMNIRLYKSPQYERVRDSLESMGVYVVKPFIEEDRVKFPPLEDLLHCVDAFANRGRDLVGKRVLVTTGATREYIDPIRVITNPSTGLMGVLIAREAFCRGAEVDLIYGSVSVKLPYGVNRYGVVTTSDMAKAVEKLTSSNKYDVAIFAAAPADYTVSSRSTRKISTRETPSLNITLRPTPKVVKHVSRSNKPDKIVVFVAETVEYYDELVSRAREKLREYEASLAIANSIHLGVGFGEEYLDACVVTENNHKCLGVVRKEVIARMIIDYVAGRDILA